jgi:F-type H+-transporting ATPase subunit delta
MKAASRPVARRYSRALLDVSKGQPPGKGKAEPSADDLAAELHASAELLEKNAALRQALFDPLLPAARKRALVEAVWTEAGAAPLVLRLLGLLVDNARLDLLPEIERAFRAAWNAERGVVEAEAVTAVELGPAQRDALTTALSSVSGLGVDLQTRLDPAVLGGVLVRMAGKSYDGTVRGRLKAMKSRLVYGI